MLLLQIFFNKVSNCFTNVWTGRYDIILIFATKKHCYFYCHFDNASWCEVIFFSIEKGYSEPS